MGRLPRAVVAVTLLLVTTPGLAHAETAPADVLTEAHHLGASVEALRAAMGKPEPDVEPLSVQDAQPREVWFQARAVWALADRLATGTIGDAAEAPTPPAAAIRPADVLDVVAAAHARLQPILALHGVPPPPAPDRAPAETTPSQVFERLVVVGQRLGVLLEHPPDAGDAFESASRSVILAARFLAGWDVDERIPPEPAAGPASWADVEAVLLRLLREVDAVARSHGHRTLSLSFVQGHRPLAALEVQLAALLEAELAFLVRVERGDTRTPPSWDPGDPPLAELHRRLLLLEEQLALIGRLSAGG